MYHSVYFQQLPYSLGNFGWSFFLLPTVFPEAQKSQDGNPSSATIPPLLPSITLGYTSKNQMRISV